MSPETCYIIDIVQHKRRNIPKVVRLLKSCNIKGNKIFTEASDTETKRKNPFYGELSKFLSQQQAIEIHEPDYEANMKKATSQYEETLSPELKALRSSSFGWQPHTIIAEFDRFTQIVCKIRDPIIANQIICNTPKYSIFGPGHIPGVLEILKDHTSLNIEVLPLFGS